MADRNILEEDILPALAGGASGLLFDIPKWIAEQIDKKAVEDYIAKHQGAWNTGNVVGSIGSGFIPVAGLAGKAIQGAGLLGKATGLGRAAAKIGSGLEKIGSATKGVGQLAARGAAEGAIGSAIRTGTDGGDLGENVTQGALFGGAGGALGGMLGQSGSRLRELKEDAAKAVIGQTPGMTGRIAMRNFAKQSGVGRAGSKLSKIDDWMERNADFALRPELKLTSKGQHPDINGVRADPKDRLTAYKKANQETFDQIDNIFASKESHDAIKASLDPVVEDLKALARESVGPKGVAAVEALAKRLNSIDNLPGKRKLLSDWIKRKAMSESDVTQMEYEAALGLSASLDDAVEEVAEKVGGPSLKQAAREYGMIENAAQAITRDEFLGVGKMNTGSPTFEKGKVYDQLKAAGGLGLAGAGIGAAGQDWSDAEKVGDNLKNVLIASGVGAALSKVPGALKQEALGASYKGLKGALENPGIQKALAKVEDIAGKSTPGLAAGLGNVASRSDETAPESMATDAAQAESEGTPESKVAFQDSVISRLKQFWDVGGYSDQFDNPDEAYQQYLQSVYAQTDGFDPMKLAAVLYPDPDDRKRYLEVLGNSQSIEQNILGATKRGGGNLFNLGGLIGGTGDAEARTAYAGVEGAFVDAAKRANIGAADAKAILKEVMTGPGSVEDKLNQIYSAIEQWDPKGIGSLRKVGLV